MTDEQRQKITNLRTAGNVYKKIGKLLGLSENTVKSFCQRRKLGGVVGKFNVEVAVCKCCGKPVPQNPGRKQKKFCSDQCRMKWWNSHLDQVNRKANYDYICPVCKKIQKKFSQTSSTACVT